MIKDLQFWLKYSRRRLLSMFWRLRTPATPNPAAQMLIEIRYSAFMPLRPSWRLARLSLDEYRQRLLSERRLEERYRLFTTIVLPSLLAQTFPMQAGLREAVLYVSEGMPAEARAKLDLLVGRYPWLRLAVIAETATEFPLPALDGYYASIRLDDDDALGVDFLERMSGYVQPAYAGSAVTFTNGVLAELATPVGEKQTWWPKNAQGLAFIGGPDTQYRTVFQLGPHHDVQKRAPLVLDERPGAFFRTVYETQDTGDSRSRRYKTRPMPAETFATYGLDQSAVEQLAAFLRAQH